MENASSQSWKQSSCFFCGSQRNATNICKHIYDNYSHREHCGSWGHQVWTGWRMHGIKNLISLILLHQLWSFDESNSVTGECETSGLLWKTWYLHYIKCNFQPLSEICRGHLSDYLQIPLVSQKALYDYYTTLSHKQQYFPRPVNTLKCVQLMELPQCCIQGFTYQNDLNTYSNTVCMLCSGGMLTVIQLCSGLVFTAG